MKTPSGDGSLVVASSSRLFALCPDHLSESKTVNQSHKKVDIFMLRSILQYEPRCSGDNSVETWLPGHACTDESPASFIAQSSKASSCNSAVKYYRIKTQYGEFADCSVYMVHI